MSKLSEELAVDPLDRSYSGMTDAQAAADLSSVYRSRQRDTVLGAEIFNTTNDAEYAALTDAEQASWDRLCSIAEIDTGSGVAKAREAELFGGGTVTRANLVTLKTENISRATELGLGHVREGDVQRARV